MDIETFEDKLLNYEEVRIEELIVGDHFRVSSNKYKQPGRKLSYCIIKSIESNGNLIVNGYKPIYKDWIIDPTHKYKQYRFYKIKPILFCGLCLICEEKIDEKFEKCYKCKNINV